MNVVEPDELGNAIVSALKEYSDDITERVFAAVDTVTAETDAGIRKHISFTQRTRKYVKAFSKKTAFQDKRNKRNTWYVKSPEYRKTHLLENGHINKNGTRTRAFPHIKYGAELAEKRLPELVEKVVKGDSNGKTG